MTSEELEHLDKDIHAIKSIADMTPKMVGLMKLMIGMLVAASLAISSVAFWVKVTTDRLEKLEQTSSQIEADRKVQINEWNSWRASKDTNDARVTIILENQNRILERMQTFQDAQRRLDILRD
jgi:hypothetical protein